MKLREEVFVALTAVVCADGVVTPEERAGLLAAAKVADVPAAGIAAIERALSGERLPPPRPWTETLSTEERLFVYSAAVWLAGIDGVVAAEETESLQLLGDQLALNDTERAIASVAATGFAPDGKHDVQALARAIEQASRD